MRVQGWMDEGRNEVLGEFSGALSQEFQGSQELEPLEDKFLL